MIYQILAFVVLMWFYGVYMGKLLIQKKQGIQTVQLGKGNKENATLIVERVLNSLSLSVVIAQIISIVMKYSIIPDQARFIGFLLGIIGNVFFTLSVITMKDSWRAGIPAKDKTRFVSRGIYRFSRNPAFVGFDCMYVGIFIMFCNIVLGILTVIFMVQLHLLILQEEKFLEKRFGAEYIAYKMKVFRYLGRR